MIETEYLIPKPIKYVIVCEIQYTINYSAEKTSSLLYFCSIIHNN